MSMRPRIALLLIAAMAAATLAACSTSSGSAAAAPTVSGAWARPGAAGADTAAYLDITGSGSADALLSASSPGATTVELHETSTDAAGMTGMHPIASLAVPAGATVTLKPGSFHLMVMGLKQALAVGDKLELELVFQNAGKIVVQAEVKAA
jgi:copper(I)-binding protein